MADLTRFERIEDVVRDFARAPYLPDGAVSQNMLDELGDVYGVVGHPDFDVASYYDGHGIELRSSAYLMSLPFRLALGIHPALPKAEISSNEAIQTYYIYDSTPTLMSHEERSTNVRRERTQAAVSGAIIDAAQNSLIQQPIENALRFTRKHGWFSRRKFRTLTRAVELTKIPT